MAKEKFIIEPHFRLQEWVAEEKGYFKDEGLDYTFREMVQSDLCCGSAGIYNVVHTDMSMALLEQKMDAVQATKATVIATANPGCMLQLQAGVRRHGHGQRVAHVVELLDEAYTYRQNPIDGGF